MDISVEVNKLSGYIYIGNFNLCKFISRFSTGRFSKFTMNHDVIEIDGVFYDPSLYDYHISL